MYNINDNIDHTCFLICNLVFQQRIVRSQPIRQGLTEI